jgi:hypothetical protein
MTNVAQQPDPLNQEVLHFSFTVAQTNGILQILGEAPYIKSATLINLIQSQGIPQFDKLLEKENGPETAATK